MAVFTAGGKVLNLDPKQKCITQYVFNLKSAGVIHIGKKMQRAQPTE